MNRNCLSDDEEEKLNRLNLLLRFIGKQKAVYYIRAGTYLFCSKTSSFYDNRTDMLITPCANMIDLFYSRLSLEAVLKLRRLQSRCGLRGIRNLLVHFHQLDFLGLTLP